MKQLPSDFSKQEKMKKQENVDGVEQKKTLKRLR